MNRSLTLAAAMFTVLFAGGYACATRDYSSATPPPRTSDVTSTAPTAPETVPSSERGAIPVGQEMDVRLSTSLSSETATVEQRFEATTVVDLIQDGRVLVAGGLRRAGCGRRRRQGGPRRSRRRADPGVRSHSCART